MNAVKNAPNGATLKISDTITATNNGSGNTANWGEIEIDKNLTIEAKSGTATLDANASALGANAHRIFKVSSGKTLTLKNLTLKNGKATGTDEQGCGGGVYVKTSSYPVVTISGGTIGDTDTDKANKATGSDGNGGGIYVGEFCTLKLQDSTDSGVRIIGNQAAKGGGVYAKNTIVSMQGRTQIEVDNNDVYLDSGSLISIVESLAATGPVARITVPNDKYQTATKVLTESAVNTEYRKFTVTPKGSEYWTVGSDGHLTNNQTDIFNTITRDQIKATLEAADPSMIYSESKIITDRTILQGKLVLYMTATRDNYGIMHVTEVNNTSGGHIKFNYKTFRYYEGDVKQENDIQVTGGAKFNLDHGGDAGRVTFHLKNTTSQKQFKPLDNAKFYILSN